MKLAFTFMYALALSPFAMCAAYVWVLISDVMTGRYHDVIISVVCIIASLAMGISAMRVVLGLHKNYLRNTMGR